MRRTLLLVAVIALAFGVGVSYAQGTVQGKTPATVHAKTSKPIGTMDSRFMMKAAQAGDSEIDLAVLADGKTKTPAVQQLAAKIKSDHEAAAADLKALAAQKDVALPSKVTAVQQATKARLDKLSDAAFDRAFAAQMVSDHRAAVALFTTATKSADVDVKAFAEKTLPVLKDHLQRAIDLQKQVAGK